MLFDKDKIQKINLFENLTNSKVKDILEDERIVFIVEEGELGKALGKHAKNIKMIENMMHKRIKVIEFNHDPLKFAKNFIYPTETENINLNNNIVEIKAKDRKSKGLLIGRDGRNLQELNKIFKEYFKLEIKIL